MTIRGEKLFPVIKAVEMATGNRIHPTTTWRWRTKGIRGLTLETRVLGGRTLTSVEAVHRFMDAQTDQRDEQAGRMRYERATEALQSRRAAKATAELKSMFGGAK